MHGMPAIGFDHNHVVRINGLTGGVKACFERSLFIVEQPGEENNSVSNSFDLNAVTSKTEFLWKPHRLAFAILKK
jgi:hypothetical protein